MSGSTQPVAQTWRAAEPRYPPHGISYPVQIARPHTVRGLSAQDHLCYPKASFEAKLLQPMLLWSQWRHWWQIGVLIQTCNLSVVERRRQEDCDLETSLGSITSTYVIVGRWRLELG